MKKKSEKKPEENKKATGKYASMYMSIGMCIGIGLGMCLGKILFDSIGIGMSFGVGIGFLLGYSYGASLDKKALNVVEIIEDDFGCEGIPDDAEAMVTVVVTDSEGKEQRIRMSDKLCYERNIEAGDSLMLDKDGTLKQIYKMPPKKKK